MATKLQFSPIDFVEFMRKFSHRHMAFLTAETCIDNKQMKGGKVTAAKYGGHVTKVASMTWNHAIDYQKAVENKLKKFDLDPTTFLAEEHKFIIRELTDDGKPSSVGYHKDDKDLPRSQRRWYLIAYIMDGIVKSKYDYKDAKGCHVEPSVLHADLYDKRSKKQADVGLVDIEQQVIYRNYSVLNLKNVRFDGYDIDII